MNLHTLVSRVSAIGLIWLLLNSSGFASMMTPWLPLPTVADGHHSSLRARVTMVDGTSKAITIQGVGCTDRICSRVRATDVMADSVWLDGLASVRAVSHNASGPVSAVFAFKNGVERHASITQLNRVLYVDGRFGRTEKLDLGSLTRIDFE
jgi:hypothetical protein